MTDSSHEDEPSDSPHTLDHPDELAKSTDGPGCHPTLDHSGESFSMPTLSMIQDRYEIEGKLGEGGMGAVYKAQDRRLDRAVALKVIRPHAMSDLMKARFEAEARAVAGLDHPHIVKVFDVGETEMPGESVPTPFITLELVEGGSLARRLGQKSLPPTEAARLVAMLARAMQHAHERGIVHRDLKPDNILLAPAESVPALNTSLGCPKITDFGLARRVESDQRMTKDGAVVGTPAYMAPEQAEGLPEIGPPVDVWALGVILHQLLSGDLPFHSTSLTDLLHKICHAEPATLADVSPALVAVVADCLQKRPGDRPTAAELAERLESFPSGDDTASLPTKPIPQPIKRRSRVGILAGVGVILIAVLTALLSPKDREPVRPEPTSPTNPPTKSTLCIKPLQVMHYETEGEDSVPRGRIGEKSSATHHGDAVTLTVELSEPAYFYIIGFNFDGREQLLWPVNEQGEPSDQVAPPKLDRVRFPSGNIRLYLDDDAKSGLQAYVVAASSRALPNYAEWRAARKGVSWNALKPGKSVWEADTQGTYPVAEGLTPDRSERGSLKEPPGTPPLKSLCKSLNAGGVEIVEAIAFPVLPKENP